jgi:uncharacterized MAPEG superfamily protein
MNITYACMLLAGLTPLIAVTIAKWKLPGYDNNNPREWMAKQTGFRARAYAAHQNCFESFPFFAVAVIMAMMAGVDAKPIDTCSVIYVVARLFYILCYVKDWATSRSIFWTIGYASIIALFVFGFQV